VTTTALAHAQWSYVVRPGTDTVIDATAGNGGDSLFLAKLLFGSGSGTLTVAGESRNESGLEPRLLCLDVDPKACQATRQRIRSAFPTLLDRYIHILHVSHDPLPVSNVSTSSVGLVVYNLGYLPHSSESVPTQSMSTLSSLAQSAQLLRVGGMVSVMTYPGSNAHEDSVVSAFMTGLALFSSRTVDWTNHTYLATDWNQDVLDRLHQVREYYGKHPITWRVHEHRKLGWLDAPTLLTATRVK
jgi:hypothetical protein